MSEKSVDPAPTGLYDDRRELWYCCTGIVNSPETADDLKQMALGIRQQLRLEARVNELTELFYSVKEQRDALLGACKEWVQYFERLQAEMLAGDPLAEARQLYHGKRIERTRAAIAKAEGPVGVGK